MSLEIDPSAPEPSAAIAENMRRVQERVRAACQRADRSPADVTIVGVSKGFPLSAVVAAYRAGLQDIGESRVQEAVAKIEAAAAQGVRPRWHLVGHLQTNKVKTALGSFDIIHSVDSLHLAEFLDKQAKAVAPILLEVNVAGEESKYGLRPEELANALERVQALPNLEVQGLMTIAPLVADAEAVRPVFRRLRELGEALGLPHLSMGMSDDFEVAVEEGATMVRIGRAIFGHSPWASWRRPDPFETPRPQTQ